jgi:hypothetical protein
MHNLFSERCFVSDETFTHGAEPFLRSCQLCIYSWNSQHCMQPQSSLPCSQEPSISRYPVPRRSSTHDPHPITVRCIWTLSTYLRLVLPSSLFRSGLPTKEVWYMCMSYFEQIPRSELLFPIVRKLLIRNILDTLSNSALLFKWQSWYSLPSITQFAKIPPSISMHFATRMRTWRVARLYSEIALSRKPFRIGQMYKRTYTFLLRMTETMTFQNIELSSWSRPVYRVFHNFRALKCECKVNFVKLPLIWIYGCLKLIFENATAGRNTGCRSVVNPTHPAFPHTT